MEQQQTPFYDVVIIGAGLSGIGAAYHVQHDLPNKKYVIFEGRANMGGTWDLFQYPGIRSDSDMYTLGFSFYPWKDPKAIADGPAIMDYIHDTARTFGIDQHIQFQHKVTSANWLPDQKRWELKVDNGADGTTLTVHCCFLFSCSGYYDYEQGYAPGFPESDSFTGSIVHPQQWNSQIDYEGKRVVVIGSGATAITLVPELAKKAASVVMLQRSPTYIVNLPREDAIANFLKRVLPGGMAHTLARWKNILFSMAFYNASRKWPEAIKGFILKNVRKEIGDDSQMRHFDPKYNPWDQRLCMVPDSDLFQAIKAGTVTMVTDTIKRFVPTGIELDSGPVLAADLIVTATGLKIKLLGGMKAYLDGQEIAIADVHCYKGVMFSNIPNFAVAVGYTNASWTLKCDLNATFVTRLINHMDQKGYAYCTPRFDPDAFRSEPLLDFDAGYIRRALEVLPKQGSSYPWKMYQNYIRDLWALKYSGLRDRFLEFSR